jgi:hypothetical protein
VDSTLNLVSLLYQENAQRELNSLQIISVMSFIVGVIGLGTLSGSSHKFFGLDGSLVYSGSSSSFQPLSLLFYVPLVILIGLIFYMFFHYIFNNTKKFKIAESEKSDQFKTMNDIQKKV